MRHSKDCRIAGIDGFKRLALEIFFLEYPMYRSFPRYSTETSGLVATFATRKPMRESVVYTYHVVSCLSSLCVGLAISLHFPAASSAATAGEGPLRPSLL
ncbi:unnamed protein product [Ectocarpus sp. 8 AP-2014]